MLYKKQPEGVESEALTKYQRLMLMLSLKNSLNNESLDEREREYIIRNIDALKNGYSNDYEILYNLDDEIPEEYILQLYSILDMFIEIKRSVDSWEKNGKTGWAALSDPNAESYGTLHGFDLSDHGHTGESRLIDYCKWLFEQDKYTELREDFFANTNNGNSHGSQLEWYLKMLITYEALDRPIIHKSLTIDQMEEIISNDNMNKKFDSMIKL